MDKLSIDSSSPESIFLLLHLCKDLAAALLVLLDIVDDGDHDGLVALQLVGNRPLQLVVGGVHVLHHPSQRKMLLFCKERCQNAYFVLYTIL